MRCGATLPLQPWTLAVPERPGESVAGSVWGWGNGLSAVYRQRRELTAAAQSDSSTLLTEALDADLDHGTFAACQAQ